MGAPRHHIIAAMTLALVLPACGDSHPGPTEPDEDQITGGMPGQTARVERVTVEPESCETRDGAAAVRPPGARSCAVVAPIDPW